MKPTAVYGLLSETTAVFYSDQDKGFGKNVTTGNDISDREDMGIRSKMVIDPTDNLRIKLSADYYENSGSYGISNVPINNSPAIDGQIGWDGDFHDIKTDIDGNIDRNDAWGLSATLDYDMEWATFRSITAHRELDSSYTGDLDATAVPLAEFPIDESNEQFTQEFHLAGDLDNGANWILGFYYLDATSSYDPFRVQGPLIGLQVQPLVDAGLLPAELAASLVATEHYADMDTTSYALFGQATFPILTDTNLTLGARYTYDEREIEAVGGLVEVVSRQVV